MPDIVEKQRRLCPKCEQEKALSGFYPVSGGARPRYVCKTCHQKQTIDGRRSRRAEYNAKARALALKPMGRSYALWARAKRRAAKRRLPFSLDRMDVYHWLLTGRCAVTGLPFSDDDGPLAPSLDRIDPRLGYTKENSRLVVWIYNRAKGDGTDEDVMIMVEALSAVGIREAA